MICELTLSLGGLVLFPSKTLIHVVPVNGNYHCNISGHCQMCPTFVFYQIILQSSTLPPLHLVLFTFIPLTFFLKMSSMT